MQETGTDTQIYGTHSLSSASSTKAVQLGRKIDGVKKHTNWSFRRHLNKSTSNLLKNNTNQFLMGLIFFFFFFGLVPATLTDNLCSLCSAASEDSFHFIYACSHKRPVWESMWDIYFDPPFSTQVLRVAIFSHLSDVKLAYKDISSSFQFFSCTLLAIWSSHWVQLFNNTPFGFDTVIRHTHSLT